MAFDRSIFSIEESLERASSVIRGTRFAKEMRKWDLPKSQGGYNTDGGEEYPKMLYKAAKVNGKNVCFMVEPLPDQFATDDQWRRASERIIRHNRECTHTVKDSAEEESARRGGWRGSQAEAIAFLDGLDDDVAKAAAHRNYEDRNMSEAAKREIAQAEAKAGTDHVAEVTEKPKRKYNRKQQIARA